MGAKKHIPVVVYPGELGEPHIRIKPASGLGMLFSGAAEKTEAESEAEARKANLDALARKLVMLAEHYEAAGSDDKLDWKKLAIALAFAHVPGFTTIETQPRKRGRPGKGLFNFDLYAAVIDILDEGEPSVANACRRLSKRAGPWKGKKPESLEARFHESKKRAAAMDLRPYLRNPETGLPLDALGPMFVAVKAKPSAKYPPVPFRATGLFALGARDLYGYEKSK